MRQGLMTPPQGQQGQPQMPPGEEPEEMTDDTPDEYLSGGQASEKEQRQYDSLMESFFGLIHSKETRDAVLKRLEAGAQNMGQTIGDMSYKLFTSVEGKVMQKGGQMTDAVRLQAGEDLVMELVQVAVAAKLMPDDEDSIGQVVANAIDVFASQYGNDMRESGRLDPQQAEGSLQELAGRAQQVFAEDPMAAGVRQAGEQMS